MSRRKPPVEPWLRAAQSAITVGRPPRRMRVTALEADSVSCLRALIAAGDDPAALAASRVGVKALLERLDVGEYEES